jgi:hypothetical protein
MDVEESQVYMSAESSMVGPPSPQAPRAAELAPSTPTLSHPGRPAQPQPQPQQPQLQPQPLGLPPLEAPLLATRIPSFNFLAGRQEELLCKALPGVSSPHTPKVVLLTATSAPSQQAQQAQQALPPIMLAPPAIAAVRPPAAQPVVQVLVEGPPGSAVTLRPLVPAQSLECSPSAQQARQQRVFGGGFRGLCRSWFGGRSSSCGNGSC